MAPHVTTTSSDAELCRSRGWTVGTQLIGDEGHGPTVIEITAIGETNILARRIAHNGEACTGTETTWTLSCRDWQPHCHTDRADTRPVSFVERIRTWLRRGGTSADWIWKAFRLWECPCGQRHGTRAGHMTHQLGCADARAYSGQG